MSFDRKQADTWRQKVPGARWFKADLHVHTIDDHPGKHARQPSGLHLDPDQPDPNKLTEYARRFLQSAVRVGVQVLGLTPHSPRLGPGGTSSAVWRIVEVWNEEGDDDGVPFREKIFAVFPGFEPNVNDGGAGVHLLFLFDPEIGKDAYLRVFDAVMDSRAPWDGNSLRITSKDAKEVFATIDGAHHDGRGTWDYLALAPHFQSAHGLLNEAKSQVLAHFPSERIAGYELGDNALPEDFSRDKAPGSFLFPYMTRHSQAFYHATDAYQLPTGTTASAGEIGYRTTWFKLASPRIEALRQAFVAHESRLRIAFERDSSGAWKHSSPPDPFRAQRRWLRRVKVSGPSAFFHRSDGGDGAVTVEFSPDLTCIIGGSMTGKSTLLDGLRVHTGADLPSDQRLKEDVEARGRNRFLAGQPRVDLDTPGDISSLPRERWPAVFFTQNELQRLVREGNAVREILSRLVPGERRAIEERDARITELDRSLRRKAREIGRLTEEMSEADQRLAAARDAQNALDAFEDAGLDELRKAERTENELTHAATHAVDLRKQAEALRDGLLEAVISTETLNELRRAAEQLAPQAAASLDGLEGLFPSAEASVGKTVEDLVLWSDGLSNAASLAERVVVYQRRLVEQKLAELGYGAEKLAEFQTLGARARNLMSFKAALSEIKGRLEAEQKAFDAEHTERENLIKQQRAAFDLIGSTIKEQFGGRLRVQRDECGITDALGAFLTNFKQKGITSWWKNLSEKQGLCPDVLVGKLEGDQLEELGCSETVARRLRERIDESKRYELRALRCPDRYVLFVRVDDNTYRRVDELSGGRRVSVLLSLLLDTDDARPLVIDQPEDELDNHFLLETVLPALRRLKGRRQVIVATHDANIVVNGDAEQVVALEADADHGHVAVAGAIEEPRVRRVIVETVDGGERAFELRKTKYGF